MVQEPADGKSAPFLVQVQVQAQVAEQVLPVAVSTAAGSQVVVGETMQTGMALALTVMVSVSVTWVVAPGVTKSALAVAMLVVAVEMVVSQWKFHTSPSSRLLSLLPGESRSRTTMPQ